MLFRVLLLLLLVTQPVIGWWGAAPAPEACAPAEPEAICCCVGAQARADGEPGRSCRPGPSRATCCTDVQRVLTTGPRLIERSGRRESEGRGPEPRGARWPVWARASVAGSSPSPGPARAAREQRPVLCVWVI